MKNRTTMNRTIFVLLLGLLTLSVYAQGYTPAEQSSSAFQSQQMMQSGSSYSGQVYTPFDNSTPAEQNSVNESTSSGSGKQIRKGLIIGPEDPLGPSPLSDEWILAVFAAIFGAAVLLRKKLLTHK